MLGAIAGDIIGSLHEFQGGKTKEFPLFVAESTFTDDSVLTVAVADCLMNGFPTLTNFMNTSALVPFEVRGRILSLGECAKY